MFPISLAASPPTPAIFHAAASASSRPQGPAVRQPDVAELRDDIVAALRNGGAVDRKVLLRLLPEMQAWPKDLPIDLLTDGTLSGQRFGPRLGYSDHDGPVYVRLRATGRYAIACSLDTPQDQWWECGDASDTDSLFHAVLVGMQLRSATRHAQFTLALQQAGDGDRTDVQGLRDRLVDELAAGHPPLMRALEGLVDARKPTGDPDAPGVDSALLQRIAAMTSDELLEAAGLRGVDDHHSVFYASLRASVAGRASTIRPSAATDAKRKIDAPLLLEILGERWANPRRSARQLAHALAVSVPQVWSLVREGFVPTPRGLERLKGTEHGPVTPVTRGFLDVAKTMQAEGRLPTFHHLYALAQLCNMSYNALHQHINTAGITVLGQDVLDGRAERIVRKPIDVGILQRIARMDRATLLASGGVAGVAGLPKNTLRRYVHAYSGTLSATGEQLIKKAADPGFARNRMNAAMFLDLVKEYRTPEHRNFDQLVRELSIPMDQLVSHLHVSGVPKARGLHLLYRDQRNVPFDRIYPPVAEAVSELAKDKLIPTSYHLLIVAYVANVSFDRLDRYFTAGTGLTRQGERLVRAIGEVAPEQRVEIPRDRLPDPTRPLWLAIDANLSLEVRNAGNTWTTRVVDFGILPAMWTQSVPLPATRSEVPHKRPRRDL